MLQSVDLAVFLAFLAGLGAVVLFGLQAWYDRRDVLLSDHRRILATGLGRLRGKLTLHGVTRTESFILQPAECARPGRDCDVVASGVINRADYGLSGYRLVLSDRVRFTMRVRLKNEDE